MPSTWTLFLIYLFIGVIILSIIPLPARYYVMGILLLGGLTYVNAEGSSSGTTGNGTGLSDFWHTLTTGKTQNL